MCQWQACSPSLSPSHHHTHNDAPGCTLTRSGCICWHFIRGRAGIVLSQGETRYQVLGATARSLGVLGSAKNHTARLSVSSPFPPEPFLPLSSTAPALLPWHVALCVVSLGVWASDVWTFGTCGAGLCCLLGGLGSLGT